MVCRNLVLSIFKLNLSSNFQGERLISPWWFDRGVYFIFRPLESIHVLLLKLYAM